MRLMVDPMTPDRHLTKGIQAADGGKGIRRGMGGLGFGIPGCQEAVDCPHVPGHLLPHHPQVLALVRPA